MTNGEKYSYYKRNRNLATAGKWTGIISPFVIIFGAKFNEYFVLVEEGERIKLTIGCILAIVVAAIAVISDFKRNEKTKPLLPAAKWGLAFLIIFLCESIAYDLLLIVGAEFAGQCAAAGLNGYAKNCNKEAEEYKKLARQDNSLGVKPIKKDKVQEEMKANKWF